MLIWRPESLQNDWDPHPPPGLKALCLTACSIANKPYTGRQPKENRFFEPVSLLKVILSDSLLATDGKRDKGRGGGCWGREHERCLVHCLLCMLLLSLLVASLSSICKEIAVLFLGSLCKYLSTIMECCLALRLTMHVCTSHDLVSAAVILIAWNELCCAVLNVCSTFLWGRRMSTKL